MLNRLVLFFSLTAGMAQILLAANTARVDDAAKARAILDAGIKAHGGEAVLGKFIACSFKLQGNDYVDDKKVPKSIEVKAQGDDKMRTVVFDEKGKKTKYIEVINGEDGWIKENNQEATEFDGAALDGELDEVYLNWATMLVPLKSEGVQLSTVKDELVAGRKARGILIKTEKHQPFKFYFDAETHLLVMCESISRRGDEDQGDVVMRIVWSDFQEVQGTKQPMKLSEIWNGAEVSDGKISDLKFYEKPLDAKLFEKP